MILQAYVDVYVLCVCIVGHGGDYTTLVQSKIWIWVSKLIPYVDYLPFVFRLYIHDSSYIND